MKGTKAHLRAKTDEKQLVDSHLMENQSNPISQSDKQTKLKDKLMPRFQIKEQLGEKTRLKMEQKTDCWGWPDQAAPFASASSRRPNLFLLFARRSELKTR